MRFLILSLLFLTSSLHANPADISFEGNYNYWSDSGDYDSLSILRKDGIYIICIKMAESEMFLECRQITDELVSEEVQGIRYYFLLHGENEIRMRKRFLKIDRPEDIEWLFYRETIQ